MKRPILALVPALTASVLWGCGGAPTVGSDGEANAGSGANAGSVGPSGGSGGNTVGVDVGDYTTSCPSSCESLNANCGTVTDSKCGGVVECGACASGETCGATTPNQCGTGGSTPTCTAKTCTDLNADCGVASDGCGNLLDCGSTTCPTGQVCGALTANHCDVGSSCTAKTCTDLGVGCGATGDGCGAQLDCGGCDTGQQCVTVDGQTQCVTIACTPKTCAERGVECGMTDDGCGNTLNCGNSCVSPKICGGDPANPGTCGCTGVCSQIPDCATGTTTSVSGKVYDPGGINPLPNALVYIANDPTDTGLQPFSTRTATCDVCGATAAGDPLVSTKTATDGSFTLTNLPVGQGLTLVIQLGRWRRIYEVDIPNACVENSLTNAGKLTMPKNQSEGDIPRIAVVTGSADGMECVFWKMGVDAAEFTNPGGTGRLNLYKGSGVNRWGSNTGKGAAINSSTPSETALFVKDTSGNIPLTNYDVLVLSCQGSNFDELATGTNVAHQPSLTYWSDLVTYGNTGGRIFASHYAYTYLRQGGASNAFRGTANWAINTADDTSRTATIITDSTLNPKGQAFADWLALSEVGGLASASNPKLSIIDPRLDVASVVSPSQAWMEIDWDNNSSTAANPLHYTFNTPVGEDNSCGRVVFSDFHVSAADSTKTFPTSCGDRDTFTAQEKILEYMLFDLSACVTPYAPLCTPKTCADLGYECGAAGDGCGNALDCGACTGAGEICGLLSPGQCDAYTCAAKTCTSLGYNCGAAGDGCGNAINCGTCPSGQTCGAGGTNLCGTASCTAKTCTDLGYDCGAAGDGCGNALDCGTCPSGQTCGAGGTGKCGTPSCTPMTCDEQDIECGAAGDGCGNAIACGNCPTGMVCGGNGAGKCGSVIQ